MKNWYRSGAPLIWLNAGAVSASLIMVVSLIGLIAYQGLGHFWPKTVMSYQYSETATAPTERLIAEIHDDEWVSKEQLKQSQPELTFKEDSIQRLLLKTGNRDSGGLDFRWIIASHIKSTERPKDVMVLERQEWGNFYGFLKEVREGENLVASSDKNNLWPELTRRLGRVHEIRSEIDGIEKDEIGRINYHIEKLRLQDRALELKGVATGSAPYHKIEAERQVLEKQYQQYQQRLVDLYKLISRDSLKAEIMDGTQITIPLSQIVRAFRPNAMSIPQKIGFYIEKLWEFASTEPREANTEGGIFPAIFGTVMMVILMAIIVTPFGVVAAVYLREYAPQGFVTRLIRIAVNNLAGVPSIVYGVFGLGFFVYFLGGSIDQLFYAEAAPAPTFGTPGILWSSLTLAILTVPVVIVATEEGLSRIPSSIREGSLALGATKAETLWRTVLPMASPAMMTGLILAVARAAGEVAPLMLVGVVKLAPTLPLDGNWPFLHLDRKFMHLGFHIYDVGFQSPNVEASRPLVFATALLLVAIIIVLNLAAIAIRNRLREKYKSLEQ
ncbi:MAG: phosphate ABC transporter permease PstA [Chromatiales bacterium]|nr:phosphate ABC transporter permease PstA [Chromatiales bacterium]